MKVFKLIKRLVLVSIALLFLVVGVILVFGSEPITWTMLVDITVKIVGILFIIGAIVGLKIALFD